LRHLKGTRIPTVKTADIAALEVVVPPIEKQRALIGLRELEEKEKRLLRELVNLREEISRTAFEKIIANHKEP
jgi:restriction endonuclease S subunit